MQFDAAAGELPPIALLGIGYREAQLSDFEGTAHFKHRLADRSGYLAVTADFNGDGVEDEARVLLNEKRGIAYVVVVTVGAEKIDTYVIEILSLEEASAVGISLAQSDGMPSDRPAADLAVFRFDGEGFRPVETKCEAKSGIIQG